MLEILSLRSISITLIITACCLHGGYYLRERKMLGDLVVVQTTYLSAHALENTETPRLRP